MDTFSCFSKRVYYKLWKVLKNQLPKVSFWFVYVIINSWSCQVYKYKKTVLLKKIKTTTLLWPVCIMIFWKDIDNFTYMNVQRNGLQVTALDRNLVKL